MIPPGLQESTVYFLTVMQQLIFKSEENSSAALFRISKSTAEQFILSTRNSLTLTQRSFSELLKVDLISELDTVSSLFLSNPLWPCFSNQYHHAAAVPNTLLVSGMMAG